MQLSLLVDAVTDLDHSENKSLNDNCGKNNSNINNGVGREELMTEEKLVTEEKLETKEEIEIKHLEGPK